MIFIAIYYSVILTLLNLLLPSSAKASCAVQQNSALCSNKPCGLFINRSLYYYSSCFAFFQLQTPLESTNELLYFAIYEGIKYPVSTQAPDAV